MTDVGKNGRAYVYFALTSGISVKGLKHFVYTSLIPMIFFLQRK